MPVTASDLKFFASAVMADSTDGGGARSATLIQNGVANNLWPQVSSGDRGTGRANFRKFYPSLTNADTGALLGMSLPSNAVPTDTAVSISHFAFGDSTTTRAQAEAGLLAWHKRPSLITRGVTAVSGNSIKWFSANGSISDAANLPAIGETIGISMTTFDTSGAAYIHPTNLLRAKVVSIGPYDSNTGFWPIEIDRPHGMTSVTYLVALRNMLTDTEVRLYGTCAVPGSLSSGNTAITVTSNSMQVVPYTGSGTYPTANLGIDPLPMAYANGRVQVVKGGDIVTLWHEAATSPASATTGGTVNVGREGIDQFAVVDNNGVEVARFLNGGPTPAGGIATVNFSTGVLTWATLTGLAQPLSVRHRISHRSAVTSVVGTTVTLTTALTRNFPSGAVISSHLPLGDVSARSANVFAQQAWTRVWSDSIIGSPVALMYSAVIGTTNQGAETDRWAIVFSAAANAFTCYSERLGLVGSGTTTSNFSPINPATGAPFFTLLAASWASEILVGSVLRFNTVAAAPPVWAIRCVAPSSPSGTTSGNFRIHGSI